MSRSQPYQPLLLRILHNLNGVLVLGSLVTGFLVYNSYDGRFGKLPLPPIPEIIDLHGTIAVFFFFFLPVFLLYSFHAGQHRLIQPDSLANLTRLGDVIGKYSLHRIINTVILAATILAVLSGRMMKEEWLPQAQLNQSWYLVHLLAWLAVVISLALHLLSNARVGGTPLLTAMVSLQVRPEDSPALWKHRLRIWWQRFRTKTTPPRR